MTQKEVFERSKSYTDCAMAAHGYASYKDDQNDRGHGGSDYSDHVWGPVILDAEGRRRPLISYPRDSTGYYAVRTVETIEHVRMPVVVAEYRYVSPTGMQPPTDYPYTNDQWHTPPSSESKYTNQGKAEPLKAYGFPPGLVDDHTGYRYHDNHGTDGPPKDSGSTNERQHSRPSLVGNNNHGTVEPPKADGSVKERGPSPRRPETARPQVVNNDYLYTIPTKVPLNSGVTNSRWRSTPSSDQVGNPLVTNPPTKMEPPQTNGPSSDNKLQKSSKALVESQPKRPNFLPHLNGQNNIAPKLTGQSGPTGYGDNNNKHNNDWNRPSGNTIRDGNNKDYYQRNEGRAEPREESGNEGRTTAPSSITALSGPTNDIDKARETLKRYTKSLPITAAARQPRYGLTPSTLPKGYTCTETIDSKEAASRYGNLNLSPQPFQEESNYSGTIDSVEAARKYKGIRV